jgi:hypothetical protein
MRERFCSGRRTRKVLEERCRAVSTPQWAVLLAADGLSTRAIAKDVQPRIVSK